jgi:hypothetical protein
MTACWSSTSSCSVPDHATHPYCIGPRRTDQRCHHPKAIHDENGCRGKHFNYSNPANPIPCECKEEWPEWEFKVSAEAEAAIRARRDPDE